MQKQLFLVITCLLLGAPLGAGQEVIDRVLSRVNGQIVTLSDLRQTRTLKLLAVDADTDEAYQRALENRLLILREMSRGAAADPDQQAIAARRREWEARLGSGPPVQERLEQAGMSADTLDSWLANDVRIKAYLEQRFSSTPAPDRPQVINHWIDMLRQRAGLR
jgi:hypothetical protein